MNKTKIIFIYFFITIVTLFIFSFYLVDQQIKNFNVKLFVSKFLINHIADAKIDIGKVDYSIGSYIRIYVNNINVNRFEENVLAANKVVIKIPVSSILIGQGTIQTIVENPVVSSSLIQFMQEKDLAKSTIELPNFFLKSKIDVKFENVIVKDLYQEKIQFDKILFKNVNLKTSMAYEFVTTIKSPRPEIDKIISQVIGEVDLSGSPKRKSIKTKIIADVHVSYVDPNYKIPRFKFDLDLLFSGLSSFEFSGQLNSDSVLEGELDGSFKDSTITLHNMAFDLKSIPINQLPYLEEWKSYSLGVSHIFLTGSSSYNFKKNLLQKNLNIALKKPVDFKYKNIPINFLGEMKIDDKQLDMDLIFNAFDGVAATKLSGNFISSFKEVSLNGDVKITNMIIDEQKLRDILWNKSQNEVEEIDYNNLGATFPTLSLNVDGNNIFINKTKFNFVSKISTKGETIHISSLDISFGSLNNLVGEVLITKSEELSTNLNLKNVPLEPFKFTLPYDPLNLAGTISGKLNLMKNKQNFQYKIIGDVTDFAIGFFDYASPVKNFLTSIGKESLTSSLPKLNNIKNMHLNLTRDRKKLKIKKSEIITDSFSLKSLNGEIDDNDKSWISGILDFKVKIPFRYEGRGNRLNPNVDYTKSKMNTR